MNERLRKRVLLFLLALFMAVSTMATCSIATNTEGGQAFAGVSYAKADDFAMDSESEGFNRDDRSFSEADDVATINDEAQERNPEEASFTESEGSSAINSVTDEVVQEKTSDAENSEAEDAQKNPALFSPLMSESIDSKIADLLSHDDNISFDPDTQTILIIDAAAMQSERMRSFGIYQAEEHIKDYELIFDLTINDTAVASGSTYYLVSPDHDSIESATLSGSLKMKANSGKLCVFILDKGDTYSVSHDIASCFYTHQQNWKDEFGKQYNGSEFTCRPTNGQLVTEHSGKAGDDAIKAEFSFEWDLSNYLDIEIWMADVINKQIENPGWVFPEGTKGYVNFLIELRDAVGNIFRLPKTYFNNYGNDNLFHVMTEDGVLAIPLSHYDDDAADGSPYGEFDVYIPFGYDYRIRLLSYSVDTLGGYAYYYNQEHVIDEDNFCVTGKSLVKDDGGNGEWGSFLEFTFMPMNKEVRIEKNVEGDEPKDARYGFQMTELVPAFANGEDPGTYQKISDLSNALTLYPYELYDAKTGERVDDGSLKTNEDGTFYMAANQYAIFKTWGLPADFADYSGSGFNMKDIYDTHSGDISFESRYIVEEVESPKCTTTIMHVDHTGNKKKIDGQKVEDVYGGDELLYHNIFSESKPESDNPTISDNHTKVTVQKVWKLDNGGKASRNICVALLRDGKYYDSVLLNEENDWQHVWQGLNVGYDWTVREVSVPEGFDAFVAKNGTHFIITNDDKPIVQNMPNTSEELNPPESIENPDTPEEPNIPEAIENPDTPEGPNPPGEIANPDMPEEPNIPEAIAKPVPISKEIKAFNVPQTGDDSKLGLWITLFFLSLLVIIFTLFSKKVFYSKR